MYVIVVVLALFIALNLFTIDKCDKAIGINTVIDPMVQTVVCLNKHAVLDKGFTRFLLSLTGQSSFGPNLLLRLIDTTCVRRSIRPIREVRAENRSVKATENLHKLRNIGFYFDRGFRLNAFK
ncbi:hypothetical protein CFB84_10635 [Burkholderia aenigmatica]|uniref:Uncharacterized protein n=1 Tax=Burkholderia aenigmatica TaxID=2015348 RepID=A0A228IYJ6_9BURK|nr:hypothetical protein CFB84_10635 [Burkholderia aenigmatica]